jgi:hypothetical protein
MLDKNLPVLSERAERNEAVVTEAIRRVYEPGGCLLVEVQKCKVRKSQKRNRTKAAYDQQPHQAAKALHLIIAIFFKCRNQQFYQVENEPREPSEHVEDEN